MKRNQIKLELRLHNRLTNQLDPQLRERPTTVWRALYAPNLGDRIRNLWPKESEFLIPLRHIRSALNGNQIQNYSILATYGYLIRLRAIYNVIPNGY